MSDLVLCTWRNIKLKFIVCLFFVSKICWESLCWIAESSKRNEKVLIRHLFGCLQMVYGLCVPGMLLAAL